MKKYKKSTKVLARYHRRIDAAIDRLQAGSHGCQRLQEMKNHRLLAKHEISIRALTENDVDAMQYAWRRRWPLTAQLVG